MRPNARQEVIMQHLLNAHTADLETLAMMCGVSHMTIRRDLDAMDEAGLLRKIRGGATLVATARSESSYRFREQSNRSEKARIAAAAVELIETDMTIMLDDGSTAMAVAEFLPAHAPLTVITSSLPATIVLAAHAPEIRVIQIGGSFAPRYEAFAGPMAVRALAELRADMALLSSSAIKDGTLFHQELEMVQLKRAMLAASDKAVLMADPSKFGRTALSLCAQIGEFDALISTSLPPEGTVEAMEVGQCRLVLAGDADGAAPKIARLGR